MEGAFLACQTGKTTTIRRTAVRGTGVSRRIGRPITGPLEPLKHHSTMVLRGLRGLSIGPPLYSLQPMNFFQSGRPCNSHLL